MNNLSRITSRQQYFLIFFLALALRLVYAFYLQKFIWGEFKYVHPDTHTYLNAFINLIENGSYCFNLDIIDSCFYRLPTYPFFIGANYSLLGGLSWISISIFQAVIDAGTCCLAVAICKGLDLRTAVQWIAACLFIFYPFSIIWVPQQMPEVIGVFLVVFAIYLIVVADSKIISIVGGGAILVLAVWTKQYIVALMPAIIFFVAARKSIKNYLFILAGVFFVFIVVYSPWVVRNIINYDRFVLMSGETTGDKHYLSDYMAAMKFIGLFYENQNEALDLIVKNGVLELPGSEFVNIHHNEIDRVAKLAFVCGPSFKTWRGDKFNMTEDLLSCERLVANGFKNLASSAKKEMSFFDYYKTGFEGFQKGFLKTNYLDKSGSSFLQRVLFSYRGVLILLGFLSVFIIRERRLVFFTIGVLVFWLGTLSVLSFGYRHVEMRYLLMADSALLICSSMTIGWIFYKIKLFSLLKQKNFIIE